MALPKLFQTIYFRLCRMALPKPPLAPLKPQTADIVLCLWFEEDYRFVVSADMETRA